MKKIILLALLVAGLSSCTNRYDDSSLRGNKHVVTEVSLSHYPGKNHTYYYEFRGSNGVISLYSDSVYSVGDTLKISK